MSRFLLVDDDNNILKMASALIKQLGFDSVAVDNALEAIELLNTQEFDVLISDATMPQFSGFDLLRTLNKNPKYNNLVKVMLTGRRDSEDVQQAVQLGVKDYIVKPIDPQLFIEKIARIMKLIPPPMAIDNSIAQLKANLKWNLNIQFELKKLSDFGIAWITNHSLPKGFEFPFHISESIQGISIPYVDLRVIHCEKRDEGFFVNTIFLNLTDKQRTDLYNAIMQRSKAA